MEKVVVTGFNIITSLGLDWESSWKAMLNGENGIKPITLFDASQNQTKFAGQLPDTFEAYSGEFIKKRLARQMTRVTKMGYVCASEAISKHNIDIDAIDKKRAGVIFGVVNTGDSSTEEGTTAKNLIIKRMNNAMSAWLGIKYKLEGPNYTVTSACSSSAFAIANGYDMIRSGRADFMIVGGADSIINKEEIEGFNELYAISTDNDNYSKASKPFSKDRDGFVIGEGAGVIILESEKSAKARNARIYAEVVDYGMTNESFNIMAPRSEGEGMAETIQQAIENAAIDKKEVGYINAHGTSTTMNDLYETIAIKNVFGDHAKDLFISSTKSMIGHTIGAAGAIESVVTILSLINGMVPPTINLENPDPELDLNYTPNEAKKADLKYALSNSFAFGGHNASLLFRKYE